MVRTCKTKYVYKTLYKISKNSCDSSNEKSFILFMNHPEFFYSLLIGCIPKFTASTGNL